MRSSNHCSKTAGSRKGWLRGLILFGLGALAACGQPGEDVAEEAVGAQQAAVSTQVATAWQPFTRASLWNTLLPSSRTETPLSSSVQGVGPLGPSDQAYGIKVYVAKSTDPLWSLSFREFKTQVPGLTRPNPMQIRAPAGMTAPTGWDGTVIIVDENRRYAYEFWQFVPRGGTSGSATQVTVLDMTTNGLIGGTGNSGLTGSGLPGAGGLLKAYEMEGRLEIRHKLWMAIDPSALYRNPTWPAAWTDIPYDGWRSGLLRLGEVIALSRNFNIESNSCGLSPAMKRIARALQNYGGIIKDQCGGSICIVSEVDAVKNNIDIDYWAAMWRQFACLKPYLVKVNSPWNGPPGGLGY